MEAKDGARSSADDLKSGDEKEPEEAAANAGHQLVMALVQHASRVLHSDGRLLRGARRVVRIEDADARRGAGDSHEQYGIFRLYTPARASLRRLRAPAVPCAMLQRDQVGASACARRGGARREVASRARSARAANRNCNACDPGLDARAPASLIAQTAVATDLERQGADGHARAAVRARAPQRRLRADRGRRHGRREGRGRRRQGAGKAGDDDDDGRAARASATRSATRTRRTRESARPPRGVRALRAAGAARRCSSRCSRSPSIRRSRSSCASRRARSPRAARGSRSAAARARARRPRPTRSRASLRAAEGGAAASPRAPRRARAGRRAARRAAGDVRVGDRGAQGAALPDHAEPRGHARAPRSRSRWSSIVSLDPEPPRGSSTRARPRTRSRSS